MPIALVRASYMSLVGKKVRRTGHITKTWSLVCHDAGVSKTSALSVADEFFCNLKHKRVFRFREVRGSWPCEYFTPVFTRTKEPCLEDML